MKQLRPNLKVRFGRICFGMFPDHGPVDGAQLGASLIEGGSGSETAKELSHAMDTTGDHGGGEVVRAGDDIGDDFGVLGICDAGFEDTDDGGRPIAKDAAIKANGFANDRRIFLERGGPETIGEDDDAVRAGAVVLRSDETTEDRVKAHNIEVVAANDASLNFARLTQADHGETDGREIAERAQGFNSGAQVLDFGHGKVCVFVADSRGALTDIDQPVLVAVNERFEKHAAYQREDGGVGADAKRQRQYHRERKPFGSSQRAECNFQIVNV